MTISLIQLQSLARERLPGKRHELLRALTDGLFELEHELSMKERELFDDIVERVLDDIEPLARQELAERLASRADAPHRIVVRLAGDIIAVASPVLMHSPVLLDDDLAPLASGKSQDHLLAISRRTQLSPRITDILVDRGDAIVLDTVAGNLGARFSGPGAAILVDKSLTSDTLWRLAQRADLAVHVAARLTPAMAKSMTAEATRRGLTLDPKLTQALLTQMRQTLADRLAASVARARPLGELIDGIESGSLRLCDAVIELADADRLFDLAVLVGERAGIDHQTFVLHLFAADEKALMRTCRAAGLDLESFSAILRLRRRRRPFSAADITRLLRAYQMTEDG
jgi:uncharacterized protein (DUF2336 family)